MPYDIVGPLGPKDLGVVTPAEQFAYQKHKDALNFVQQQAQQDALSRAISGKSGWQDDPMGSDAPTPAAAPSYLDKHNAMVDLRQQQTRGLEDADAIARGPQFDIAGQHDLEVAQNKFALDHLGVRQDALKQYKAGLQAEGGVGGIGVAPMSGGASPTEIPNAGVLGGAAQGAGAATMPIPNAGARMSDDDFLREQLRMQGLASVFSGQPGPDVAGTLAKRQEMQQQAQLNALKLADMQGEMGDKTRERATARAKADLDAGDPVAAAADAKAGGVPMLGAQYDAVKQSIQPDLAQVHDFIRRHNWDIGANADDLNVLYNSTLMKLRKLHPSPDADALIRKDLNDTMRKALDENGLIFKSRGTQDVKNYYGL